MSYDYAVLAKKAGSTGLKARVLIAPISWFAAIQTPTGSNAGDQVTIGTAHTFKDSKGWVELYATKDTSELVSEMVGERDSRNLSTKLTFFHPGLGASALETLKNARNDDFIVLVDDLEGAFYQIGTEHVGCDITYTLNSGKLSGGQKGAAVEAMAFGDVFIYTGTVTMKP